VSSLNQRSESLSRASNRPWGDSAGIRGVTLYHLWGSQYLRLDHRRVRCRKYPKPDQAPPALCWWQRIRRSSARACGLPPHPTGKPRARLGGADRGISAGTHLAKKKLSRIRRNQTAAALSLIGRDRPMWPATNAEDTSRLSACWAAGGTEFGFTAAADLAAAAEAAFTARGRLGASKEASELRSLRSQS